MKLNFHSDPGHGWLQVPLSEIQRLGIGKQISHYSYMSARGPNPLVYLEEDCDASIFIEAAKSKGEQIEFNDVSYNDECFIRGLPNFTPTNVGRMLLGVDN
ncbi:MAG: hypothetical protein Q7R95_11420 [bacterium]|nr:hypothetical protein [bacterium]